MTHATRKTIATVLLGVAGGINGVAVIVDLVRQQLAAAGVQALALVFLAVVFYLVPIAGQGLEAQLALWTARRDHAVLEHEALTRQLAAITALVEPPPGGRVQ